MTARARLCTDGSGGVGGPCGIGGVGGTGTPRCFPAYAPGTRLGRQRSLVGGGLTVSAEKKGQAKGEQAKGRAKETAGRALGDERLETEGRSDQSKGDARQAIEKIKDIFRR